MTMTSTIDLETNLEKAKRWDTALQAVHEIRYASTLLQVCVAILRTDWDRTDPNGFLNLTPSQVDNFLRSYSVRNFAFEEQSIGVRKTLCHIIDAFRAAAAQKRRQAA
jgi:hypothetical protein